MPWFPGEHINRKLHEPATYGGDVKEYEYKLYFRYPVHAWIDSDKPLTAQQALIEVLTGQQGRLMEIIDASAEAGWDSESEFDLLLMEQIAHDAVLKRADEEDDRYND